MALPSWATGWNLVTGDLQPGVAYAVDYNLTCLNGVSPGALSQALAKRGIRMSVTASLIAGALFQATDRVSVDVAMSQAVFTATFNDELNKAEQGTWIGCTEFSPTGFYAETTAPPLFSLGLGSGLVLAFVILALFFFYLPAPKR